ncbi:MAG: tRNA epoxyqueuosine(34) reductase QueG [Verrucomicrobiales bacterium]
MKELIRQRAVELGFDACRFTTAEPPDHAAKLEAWLEAGHHGEMGYLARNAFKRVDPNQVLPGAKSMITLATSYWPARCDSEAAEAVSRNGSHPEKASFKGVVARYAQYDDYHLILAEKLKGLTEFLTANSPEVSRSLWYVDTGPLLERDLAMRAGLGFVGKHTNLISRSLGNWFFLSEIITTVEFPPDASEHNRCGSCTRCLAACPTQAILKPFKLDARKCISYLTIELKGSIPVEFRKAIGNRIYGCDDCLNACPWNRFAREGSIMKQSARGDLEQPDLLALLELDDAAFKVRFAKSPILRTKRRGLLRNVCVALGNIGDRRALPALQKAASDHEPLIVEHAAWAIDEIQGRTVASME